MTRLMVFLTLFMSGFVVAQDEIYTGYLAIKP